MTLRQKVEDNLALWVLGFLFTGFMAGVGSYRAILHFAQLDTVARGSYVLKDDLPDLLSPKSVDGNEHLPRTFEREEPTRSGAARNAEAPVAGDLSESPAKAVTPRQAETSTRSDLEIETVVHGIGFPEPTCTHRDKKLICELIAISQERDREIEVISRWGALATRVVEIDGTSYGPIGIKVGSNSSTTRTSGILTRNIPIKIVLQFPDVRDRPIGLSMLEIAFQEEGEYRTAAVRNVRLRKSP